MHRLSWKEAEYLIFQLAEQIRLDGFNPDCILSITRGGLIPAGILSYQLDIKIVNTVCIESYSGVDTRLSNPKWKTGIPYEYLKEKILLVVDDVAETGQTLKEVLSKLENVSTVKSAVIYLKHQSSVTPDFFAATASEWVLFPWNIDD